MKFTMFRYPVSGDGDLSDLNGFLSTHRVVSVQKNWVQAAEGAVLVFLVETADGEDRRESSRESGDATKGLDAREIALYNTLRDLRRQIAEAEAVPIWSLFGNQALRLIVKQRPVSQAALAAIPGVGKAKAEKHGERILSALRDQPGADPSAAPSSTTSR